MDDDLRARIVEALEPHTHNGHLVDAELDDIIDAVMAVVKADRIHAFNNPRGRCRWCNVITSEVVARGRDLQPHRMTCRFYVGPVEHRVIGGHQAFTHWATECSCGQSWDTERSDICPNNTET